MYIYVYGVASWAFFNFDPVFTFVCNFVLLNRVFLISTNFQLDMLFGDEGGFHRTRSILQHILNLGGIEAVDEVLPGVLRSNAPPSNDYVGQDGSRVMVKSENPDESEEMKTRRQEELDKRKTRERKGVEEESSEEKYDVVDEQEIEVVDEEDPVNKNNNGRCSGGLDPNARAAPVSVVIEEAVDKWSGRSVVGHSAVATTLPSLSTNTPSNSQTSKWNRSRTPSPSFPDSTTTSFSSSSTATEMSTPLEPVSSIFSQALSGFVSTFSSSEAAKIDQSNPTASPSSSFNFFSTSPRPSHSPSQAIGLNRSKGSNRDVVVVGSTTPSSTTSSSSSSSSNYSASGGASTFISSNAKKTGIASAVELMNDPKEAVMPASRSFQTPIPLLRERFGLPKYAVDSRGTPLSIVSHKVRFYTYIGEVLVIPFLQGLYLARAEQLDVKLRIDMLVERESAVLNDQIKATPSLAVKVLLRKKLTTLARIQDLFVQTVCVSIRAGTSPTEIKCLCSGLFEPACRLNIRKEELQQALQDDIAVLMKDTQKQPARARLLRHVASDAPPDSSSTVQGKVISPYTDLFTQNLSSFRLFMKASLVAASIEQLVGWISKSAATYLLEQIPMREKEKKELESSAEMGTVIACVISAISECLSQSEKDNILQLLTGVADSPYFYFFTKGNPNMSFILMKQKSFTSPLFLFYKEMRLTVLTLAAHCTNSWKPHKVFVKVTITDDLLLSLCLSLSLLGVEAYVKDTKDAVHPLSLCLQLVDIALPVCEEVPQTLSYFSRILAKIFNEMKATEVCVIRMEAKLFVLQVVKKLESIDGYELLRPYTRN